MGLFFLGPAVAAAIIATFGFLAVFELASAGLLLGFLIGRRVLSGRAAAASTTTTPESLWQRVRAQFALVAGHADMRRTMLVDCLTQLAVAYFVVFALVLAVRRFGMPLAGRGRAGHGAGRGLRRHLAAGRALAVSAHAGMAVPAGLCHWYWRNVCCSAWAPARPPCGWVLR